ncbi:hypothetical protein EW146_g4087 [Bondarzewia mesenterica]|uniref:SET domain-containing protein n=1 Tax=Bondarzewia mesenterica TaxID=1095465 RepID=A0A4S4LXF4_9AGAM|nr:hypothetical protein EW146_g4087 [Bondarzewia mesenterica]
MSLRRVPSAGPIWATLRGNQRSSNDEDSSDDELVDEILESTPSSQLTLKRKAASPLADSSRKPAKISRVRGERRERTISRSLSYSPSPPSVRDVLNEFSSQIMASQGEKHATTGTQDSKGKRKKTMRKINMGRPSADGVGGTVSFSGPSKGKAREPVGLISKARISQHVNSQKKPGRTRSPSVITISSGSDGKVISLSSDDEVIIISSDDEPAIVPTLSVSAPLPRRAVASHLSAAAASEDKAISLPPRRASYHSDATLDLSDADSPLREHSGVAELWQPLPDRHSVSTPNFSDSDPPPEREDSPAVSSPPMPPINVPPRPSIPPNVHRVFSESRELEIHEDQGIVNHPADPDDPDNVVLPDFTPEPILEPVAVASSAPLTTSQSELPTDTENSVDSLPGIATTPPSSEDPSIAGSRYSHDSTSLHPVTANEVAQASRPASKDLPTEGLVTFLPTTVSKPAMIATPTNAGMPARSETVGTSSRPHVRRSLYSGPNGLFKDVFAARRQSRRSSSSSTRMSQSSLQTSNLPQIRNDISSPQAAQNTGVVSSPDTQILPDTHIQITSMSVDISSQSGHPSPSASHGNAKEAKLFVDGTTSYAIASPVTEAGIHPSTPPIPDASVLKEADAKIITQELMAQDGAADILAVAPLAEPSTPKRGSASVFISSSSQMLETTDVAKGIDKAEKNPDDISSGTASTVHYSPLQSRSSEALSSEVSASQLPLGVGTERQRTSPSEQATCPPLTQAMCSLTRETRPPSSSGSPISEERRPLPHSGLSDGPSLIEVIMRAHQSKRSVSSENARILVPRSNDGAPPLIDLTVDGEESDLTLASTGTSAKASRTPPASEKKDRVRSPNLASSATQRPMSYTLPPATPTISMSQPAPSTGPTRLDLLRMAKLRAMRGSPISAASLSHRTLNITRLSTISAEHPGILEASRETRSPLATSERPAEATRTTGPMSQLASQGTGVLAIECSLERAQSSVSASPEQAENAGSLLPMPQRVSPEHQSKTSLIELPAVVSSGQEEPPPTVNEEANKEVAHIDLDAAAEKDRKDESSPSVSSIPIVVSECVTPSEDMLDERECLDMLTYPESGEGIESAGSTDTEVFEVTTPEDPGQRSPASVPLRRSLRQKPNPTSRSTSSDPLDSLSYPFDEPTSIPQPVVTDPFSQFERNARGDIVIDGLCIVSYTSARQMEDYPPPLYMAKDIPHTLQDRMNSLDEIYRKTDMALSVFEAVIFENTSEDEPDAPRIKVINEFDDEITPPWEFHYSNQLWHDEDVPPPDITNLRGCGCVGHCDPRSETCSCLQQQQEYLSEHGGPSGFIYDDRGRLKFNGFPIFECNDLCGCLEDCKNRVVQNGRKHVIDIRKTEHKGWGVFAGPKKIPKGSFVGIYAGELITDVTAEERGKKYNKFGRTYLFDLDFWYLKQDDSDWQTKYCVDAYHAGNFTRFLNHSCSPNCTINACYINEANLDKPLLTVFTCRDVDPFEELCFSYHGNPDDMEDEDKHMATGATVKNQKNDAIYTSPHIPFADMSGPTQQSSPAGQFAETNMGLGPAYGPWKYRILHEPHLTAELARMSSATKIGNADCVTIQPCPNSYEASQDRYTVQDWQLADGNWRFAAIFDGHAGAEMVDYTVQNFPPHLRAALESTIDDSISGQDAIRILNISNTLSRAIASFDNAMLDELLAIFPGGLEEIDKLSDKEIHDIIHRPENLFIVVRNMRGTTALVCLVDASALGTRDPSGEWKVTLLSSYHNASNPAEAERIRSEHPGEPECILRERVLGSIALTRAIGDYLYRLPRVWTDRIFLQSKIGFRYGSAVREFIVRNHTPPYLNNEADVQHVRLNSPAGSAAEAEHLLVMCSDGLTDLYADFFTLEEAAIHWIEVLNDNKTSAEDQRDHYRSDHHRYNMKRRVASLPPVSVEVFNQKVLERRQETAVMLSPKGSTCDICKFMFLSKSYTTENAYRSHMNSKKHKENELKVATQSKMQPAVHEETAPVEEPTSSSSEQPTQSAVEASPSEPPKGISLNVDVDADENAVNETIDQKIAAARSRLSPSQCLFCPVTSSSLEDNLTHMSTEHSFFIPDADYLVDLTGLVTYLGEKIAVGNVCVFCNGKGREFRTLDAVRKHMTDKSHCKIAYDSEKDQLELSEFYDFSASYPDAEERRKRKEERKARKLATAAATAADEGWEDDEEVDDGEVDEVIEEETSEPEESDSDESSSDDDSLPDNQITYGDSHLELVLPSGARIGHRSMRRYYAQSFPGAPRGGKLEDPNSGAALVRRLLADKNSALVPRKGGFGAFGSGTEVIKARNRGEAREAGRHVREFRDQKRREDFKTKMGFINNHQKHYRDPLLQ